MKFKVNMIADAMHKNKFFNKITQIFIMCFKFDR
jgi:hypothetical protein